MLGRLSAHLSQEFDVILGLLSAPFSLGRNRIFGPVASRLDRVEQTTCRGDCELTTTVHHPHFIIVPPSLAERY